MKRRFPVVEIAIAAVAFALLVAISVQREARRNEAAYDTFSTYDYRSGGYRAWYELLERIGRAPQRFERYPVFLDRSVATLIAADPLPFTDAPMEISEANAAALARWVREGGRLVLIGQGPLSEALAKELSQPELSEAAQAGAKHPPAPQIAPVLAAAGVGSVAPPGARRFRAARGFEVVLSDRRGIIVSRTGAGRGELIVVADEQMLSNAHIGSADHARLAAALAARPGGGAVAFDETLHGYLIAEHWWELVPRAFLVAVAIALAAVALAGIGAAIRLGPPALPRTRREATSGEYIDALAALFERAGAAGHAVTAAYISTRRAIARKFGLSDEVADEELAAHLGTAQMRGAFSELASLAKAPSATPAALVRGVRLAQTLRKDLGSGSR
jgi:hypothetical protein